MEESQDDIKREMLDILKKLPPEVLADLNEAIQDALCSAARGEPSRFAINELVHITKAEARRICTKIGLDWQEEDR